MRCTTATPNNLRCCERFLDAHRPRRRPYQSDRPGTLGGHRRSKL
jgi:hypothetical protein